MKVAIASDHAGFAYKEKVKDYLASKGYEVIDYGAYSDERTDYPDTAHKAASGIQHGEADRGVLVCGSGIGMAMTANRHSGIRAVEAVTDEMAKLSRQHNNANVLALGQRLVSWEEAEKIIDTFFATAFEGGRHEQRVAKIENV
jgi:ribose 5-phosphate isomerase B